MKTKLLNLLRVFARDTPGVRLAALLILCPTLPLRLMRYVVVLLLAWHQWPPTAVDCSRVVWPASTPECTAVPAALPTSGHRADDPSCRLTPAPERLVWIRHETDRP